MIIEQRPILESIDPEILDTLAAREHEIAQGASMSSSTAALLALGSIPLRLARWRKMRTAKRPVMCSTCCSLRSCSNILKPSSISVASPHRD